MRKRTKKVRRKQFPPIQVSVSYDKTQYHARVFGTLYGAARSEEEAINGIINNVVNNATVVKKLYNLGRCARREDKYLFQFADDILALENDREALRKLFPIERAE